MPPASIRATNELMCGRSYKTYSDEELQIRYDAERLIRKQFKDAPNYNMCPTQTAPIVIMENGKKVLKLMRWGLVPFWAKSVKDADKYSMINAKSEEIEEKRSFKNAFLKRRCIVPVSGFFEWKRQTKSSKIPHVIRLKKDPIMSLAGIWEYWESKEDGEVVESFALITTAANKFMSKIHDRMPVILDKKDEDAWLDPENIDPKNLKKLLIPCGEDRLESYQVSTAVNSPKNNSPEVLEPLKLKA